jgi:hypothetical protein
MGRRIPMLPTLLPREKERERERQRLSGIMNFLDGQGLQRTSGGVCVSWARARPHLRG